MWLLISFFRGLIKYSTSLLITPIKIPFPQNSVLITISFFHFSGHLRVLRFWEMGPTEKRGVHIWISVPRGPRFGLKRKTNKNRIMTIILPAKTVITLHPLITIIIVTIAKNLKKKLWWVYCKTVCTTACLQWYDYCSKRRRNITEKNQFTTMIAAIFCKIRQMDEKINLKNVIKKWSSTIPTKFWFKIKIIEEFSCQHHSRIEALSEICWRLKIMPNGK